MAYSPLFDRTPCSASCSCASIPPHLLRSLVVYDRDIMDYYKQNDQHANPNIPQYDFTSNSFARVRTLIKPRGIIFKYHMNNTFIITHTVANQQDQMYLYFCSNQQNVNQSHNPHTLQETAFKILSVLVENLVRRRYTFFYPQWPTNNPHPVLHYHFEQYLECLEIIPQILGYNHSDLIPVLLPKFDLQKMGRHIRAQILQYYHQYPGQIDLGVCMHHRNKRSEYSHLRLKITGDGYSDDQDDNDDDNDDGNDDDDDDDHDNDQDDDNNDDNNNDNNNDNDNHDQNNDNNDGQNNDDDDDYYYFYGEESWDHDLGNDDHENLQWS